MFYDLKFKKPKIYVMCVQPFLTTLASSRRVEFSVNAQGVLIEGIIEMVN